jgi:HSP20 family molecular chaperone IbpA
LNVAEIAFVVESMNKTSSFLLLSTLITGAVAYAAQPSPAPSGSPIASASTTASPYSTPSPQLGSSPFDPAAPWDPMADMQRMQTEMNQFFSRAVSEFGLNQKFLSNRSEPGFASSIDVRDKGDHYEVHAFLPGAEINNVKVTADSNNLLRVSASESKQQKKESQQGTTLMSEFGEYQQLVTLPGPARTKDMKVERKEHEVVITVPKKTK